jgi:hypothetical protein
LIWHSRPLRGIAGIDRDTASAAKVDVKKIPNFFAGAGINPPAIRLMDV